MARRSPDHQNQFMRKFSLHRFRRSKGRSSGQIRPVPAPKGMLQSPYSYRIVNVSGKGEGVSGSVAHGSSDDMFARIRKSGTQIGWVITHRNESDESLNHVEAFPLESEEEFKTAVSSDENATCAEIWRTPDQKIHHIPVNPKEVHVT